VTKKLLSNVRTERLSACRSGTHSKAPLLEAGITDTFTRAVSRYKYISTMRKMAMVAVIGLACLTCQSADASAIGSDALGRLVTAKAQQHNVPVRLAHAIVEKESNFNPRAMAQGNYGLGQIRCGTARGMGFRGPCSNLLDPETNLDYSMRYLRSALDRSNGDWCKAATLYNRGTHTRPVRSAYCDRVLRIARSL
jgi:soluble lytic murein transglycosylase-like protein